MTGLVVATERQRFLNPTFTRIGAGYATGRRGPKYVQDFGKKRGD